MNGVHTRRRFLQLSASTGLAGMAASLTSCARIFSPAPTDYVAKAAPPIYLNDVQSRLNRTAVRSVFAPDSVDALSAYVKQVSEDGGHISVAGTRHAMGTQQFATDAHHVDTTALTRIHGLDEEQGLIDVECGVTWPEIIRHTATSSGPDGRPWSIIQKQTGANHFSIGGALASNIHGRGLTLRPIIDDVESLELLTASGELLHCSRTSNAPLFKLAIGGYGLFGIVTRIRLRLMPRERMQRAVTLTTTESLMPRISEHIANGFLYGDFQYKTDPQSDGFMREGVLSCYRPVPYSTQEATAHHQALTAERWKQLYMLAHMDKARAYETYASYYQSTDGQLYWSDQQQLTTYLPPDQLPPVSRPGETAPGSLMITEIYVPRDQLLTYMEAARTAALQMGMDIIYGTIRMIQKDTESILRWAKDDYACVIFNLRVVHDTEGLARAQEQFRALIDEAIAVNGSYYLTYHRWARRDQLLACYPQFPVFLQQKQHYDPGELFQSDWYRHYVQLLDTPAPA